MDEAKGARERSKCEVRSAERGSGTGRDVNPPSALRPSPSALRPLATPLLVPVAATVTYLAAHPRRRRPRRTPASLGIHYAEVTLSALDGTRLAAWWVPAPEARAVVILCHGYGRNREQLLAALPPLHRAGYHALLFDFRAHGESEGRRCGIGHAEVDDLLGAADWLRRHPTAASLPLIAMGFSMGGAVSILGAARDPRIAVVVADSVFPTLEQAVQRREQLLLGALSPLVQPPVRRVWRRLHQVDPEAISPIEAIGRLSPRPVMLIHCEQDIYLCEEDVRALYDRAGDPREFWQAPNARHIRALDLSPDDYMERVFSFLRRLGL